MSGYYQANPHYQPDDFSEDVERLERAEAEGSRWFNDLTRPQLARFNDYMAVARAYRGSPRWDRMQAAAKKEFAETTTDAAAICQMVIRDCMALGEVSEATSYLFDECLMRQMMASAA